MSNITSNLSDKDALLEIAVLQKKILSFVPCMARLKIPSLMKSSIEEYLEIPMPLEVSMIYGQLTIPAGTRFIVKTVAGNYNDIKIIGFYDKPANSGINIMEYIKQYTDTRYSLSRTGEHSFSLNEIKPKSPYPNDYGIFDYDIIR